ncbi:MAG: DUF177 domain-containing protein [Acidimicrobiales bacterium]|nr:DUF177 domain-containing protein [Acidimicrobiales bacterium]
MPRPFVVRVGDLLREPGSRRDVDVRVDVEHYETTAARTIPGTDLTLAGVVMAMAGGVEVKGEVGFDWWGECRRCLRDVHGHRDIEFREIAQRDPVDEEVLPIEGDLLDLEPLVRELVLSGLPLAPLCGDDCPGPDPERFPTATAADVEEEAAAREPQGDPRWAALDELDLGDDPDGA